MKYRHISTTTIPIVVCLAATLTAAEPRFERQTIDSDIQIGYGLAVGRVDADELVDVLLADKREIVWYKNAGAANQPWTKHVIASELTARDNVCIAARDIDGDGLVEVAVGANWNPGETSDVRASGALFYLRRPSEPTLPWDPIPIAPYDPTTHRMHWVRVQGNEMRLAVLPLHGVDNSGGDGRNVLLSLYQVSDNIPRLVEQIDTLMHMTHNFEVLSDPDRQSAESMLVAGKEGYAKLDASGAASQLIDSNISKGAGEVRAFDADEKSLVGIEPMHGTDVSLYRRSDNGAWRKVVLDTTLGAGHALAAANLCGDDHVEIVAGWRSPDGNNRVGIKVFTSDGQSWTSHLIDDNQMACEDLKLCDFDADGRLDIVAAGRATSNVVVYWNRSE